MDVAGTSADYGADTEHCSVGGEKLMLFLRSSTLDDRVLRPLSNLRHQQLPACDYKTLDTLEHVDAVPAIPRHLRVLAPISTKEDSVLASTAKSSIVQPSRLPVIYTPTKTPRYALDDVDDVVDPLDLAGDGDGMLCSLSSGAEGPLQISGQSVSTTCRGLLYLYASAVREVLRFAKVAAVP